MRLNEGKLQTSDILYKHHAKDQQSNVTSEYDEDQDNAAEEVTESQNEEQVSATTDVGHVSNDEV